MLVGDPSVVVLPKKRLFPYELIVAPLKLVRPTAFPVTEEFDNENDTAGRVGKDARAADAIADKAVVEVDAYGTEAVGADAVHGVSAKRRISHRRYPVAYKQPVVVLKELHSVQGCRHSGRLHKIPAEVFAAATVLLIVV